MTEMMIGLLLFSRETARWTSICLNLEYSLKYVMEFRFSEGSAVCMRDSE